MAESGRARYETTLKAAAAVWRSIGRAAAWLLLPLLLLQFLSGYAILHPHTFRAVLDTMTAIRIHRAIQPLTLAAFVVHGFPWIRRRLAKRSVSGRWLDVLLTLLGAGLIAFGTYLWASG
jgi:hypothetical protein